MMLIEICGASIFCMIAPIIRASKKNIHIFTPSLVPVRQEYISLIQHGYHGEQSHEPHLE